MPRYDARRPVSVKDLLLIHEMSPRSSDMYFYTERPDSVIRATLLHFRRAGQAPRGVPGRQSANPVPRPFLRQVVASVSGGPGVRGDLKISVHGGPCRVHAVAVAMPSIVIAGRRSAAARPAAPSIAAWRGSRRPARNGDGRSGSRPRRNRDCRRPELASERRRVKELHFGERPHLPDLQREAAAVCFKRAPATFRMEQILIPERGFLIRRQRLHGVRDVLDIVGIARHQRLDALGPERGDHASRAAAPVVTRRARRARSSARRATPSERRLSRRARDVGETKRARRPVAAQR